MGEIMGEILDSKCLYFKDREDNYKILGSPSEICYSNKIITIPSVSIKIPFPKNVMEYVNGKKENVKKPKEITVSLPEKYIINENACILFWKDGEKTIVKRCADDKFNPRLAFLTAFFQHYVDMSKNKANKYLASLQVEIEQKQKPKHMKEETNFKVGDRVEVIKENTVMKKGSKGKIVELDSSGSTARVRFDDNKDRWLFKSRLKLIKEEK